MPITINDDENPANADSTLNLIQIVQSLAYQVKQLTGKSNWHTPPDQSVATAVKGDKGDTGDIGATGPQGAKGDTGTVGATGLQGVKGDKGDTGAVGATGPQGVKGDKGNDGVSPTLPATFLFFQPTKISVTNTTALTQLYSFSIPANTLTANTILQITALLGMSNNTNTKTFRCRIGNTDIFSSSSQISGYTSVLYQRSLLLRSSTSQITIPNDINAYSRYTNSIQEFTFDFSQNQTLSFHVQPSVASDSMWLEYVYGQVLKL